MDNVNVVVVRGLRKRYGGRTVVDGLDLDVGAREIVGLIGANGAGKTTTVECIQGLRHPDAGTLRVFGLDPVNEGEKLRCLVGSQLQSSGLPDRLRVGEALHLFAGRHDDDDLLEEFGLSDRRRSAFGSLSGGERQRLFLVLALVNRPRLVILDELTQGLGPLGPAQCVGGDRPAARRMAPLCCWSPTSSRMPNACVTGWWRCGPGGSSTPDRPPSSSTATGLGRRCASACHRARRELSRPSA